MFSTWMDNMETNTQWVHPPSINESAAKSACPVCGGHLSPQRNACKCQRCGYIVCESCDLEMGHDWLSEGE